MVKEVGVFNAPPVYVMGLSGLSSAGGYTFESVQVPLDWVHRHRDSVLLVGIRSDGDLEMVGELKRGEPASVLVTLVDEFNIDSVRDSLAAGASGAVSRDAPAAEIILALNAALVDSTVMPADLARSLAERNDGDEPLHLEEREVSWLQSLAQSTTVSSLGDSAGYSEREMYRRLKRIYYKMGVRTRTEALLKASRLGWIH